MNELAKKMKGDKNFESDFLQWEESKKNLDVIIKIYILFGEIHNIYKK